MNSVHRFRFARFWPSLSPVVLVALVGCHDANGLRPEVTPGEQGRTEVHYVKEDPKVIQQKQAVAAVTSDPDLEKLTKDWQKLSAKDRKTVLDLVDRLSAQ